MIDKPSMLIFYENTDDGDVRLQSVQNSCSFALSYYIMEKNLKFDKIVSVFVQIIKQCDAYLHTT